MPLYALATTSTFIFPSPIYYIAILALVLGLIGLISLWHKGKRIEAVTLLNTVLLIIIIILLLFNH
jgi:hypothetical protein